MTEETEEERFDRLFDVAVAELPKEVECPHCHVVGAHHPFGFSIFGVIFECGACLDEFEVERP